MSTSILRSFWAVCVDCQLWAASAYQPNNSPKTIWIVCYFVTPKQTKNRVAGKVVQWFSSTSINGKYSWYNANALLFLTFSQTNAKHTVGINGHLQWIHVRYTQLSSHSIRFCLHSTNSPIQFGIIPEWSNKLSANKMNISVGSRVFVTF